MTKFCSVLRKTVERKAGLCPKLGNSQDILNPRALTVKKRSQPIDYFSR